MTEEKEIWKRYWIDGESTKYEWSNFGRLRSFYRGELKVLCPPKTKKGYLRASISHKGVQYKKLVHQAVGELFLENPNNYPQVNHKNTIRCDNYWKNLEWCDNSMNIKHAYDNGLITPMIGSKNPAARKVGRFKDGLLVKEYEYIGAAEIEGFSRVAICSSIKKGYKSGGFVWKYLDEPNKKIA